MPVIFGPMRRSASRAPGMAGSHASRSIASGASAQSSGPSSPAAATTRAASPERSSAASRRNESLSAGAGGVAGCMRPPAVAARAGVHCDGPHQDGTRGGVLDQRWIKLDGTVDQALLERTHISAA